MTERKKDPTSLTKRQRKMLEMLGASPTVSNARILADGLFEAMDPETFTRVQEAYKHLPTPISVARRLKRSKT